MMLRDLSAKTYKEITSSNISAALEEDFEGSSNLSPPPPLEALVFFPPKVQFKKPISSKHFGRRKKPFLSCLISLCCFLLLVP